MLFFSAHLKSRSAVRLRGQLLAIVIGGPLLISLLLPAANALAAPAIVVPAPLPEPATQPAAPQPTAASGTTNVGNSLTYYQMALDQLAKGETASARILLQDAIRNNGNQPELNVLLAYILQREDHADEAQKWLAPVSEVSPLALEYSHRLNTLATAATPTTISGVGAPAVTTHISLEQGDARLAKLEESLVALVNAERVKNGLDELVIDSRLASVARAHSAEMRDLNYFAHESPTPALRTLVERYRAVFNTTPRTVAENIHRAWGRRHVPDQDDVNRAHESFMNSPTHRANILLGRVTRIGIGIVANENGDIWVTQMFSRI